MPSRRRGVSEIVGSLIILLIVSTLGTYLYNHSLTVITYQQDSLEHEMKISSERAQERFRVTAIWWSSSYDLFNITVYNFGNSEISVSDIYINSERVNSFLYGRNESIGIKELGKVCFSPPSPIPPDNIFEIVIVSQRGVSDVYHKET